MDPRKVPEGRLGRLSRIALVGARLGASKLFDHNEHTAIVVTEMLGTLRGLASKVGQMASYVDGVLPETTDGPWQKALSALRAAAPSSPPEEVRAILESDLGAPLDALFASFELTPFASASIGQVHRATLEDGTAVAVKVQHPGIAKALESDLQNAGLLESVLSPLAGRHLHARELLAEARARFREELDYELEADRMRSFTKVHEGVPSILIPRVIDNRSSKRVLCAEFVSGATFDDACEATIEERRRWAETLWRFVFRGVLVGGMFNADPHPGNYVFLPEGRVAFLDFGCVQPLSKEHQRTAVQVHLDAAVRDENTFRRSAGPYLRATPGKHEDLAVKFMRSCFDPLFLSPFRVTRPYVAGLVAELRASAKEAGKLPIDQVPPLPEEILFMNRLQFGFYSVLARLDVPVDYSAVEKEFLDEAAKAVGLA